MSKTSTHSATVVRDTKTGKIVTVHGAGALRDSALRLKKGIDLTKPIASQTLKEKRK
jgi:hypothetical protein